VAHSSSLYRYGVLPRLSRIYASHGYVRRAGTGYDLALGDAWQYRHLRRAYKCSGCICKPGLTIPPFVRVDWVVPPISPSNHRSTGRDDVCARPPPARAPHQSGGLSPCGDGCCRDGRGASACAFTPWGLDPPALHASEPIPTADHRCDQQLRECHR
jgi:hypothetical protein